MGYSPLSTGGWYGKYPIIYMQGFIHPRWLAWFLPSTVHTQSRADVSTFTSLSFSAGLSRFPRLWQTSEAINSTQCLNEPGGGLIKQLGEVFLWINKLELNRVFHYKPSILGYPYSRKHPYQQIYRNKISSLKDSNKIGSTADPLTPPPRFYAPPKKRKKTAPKNTFQKGF